MVEKSSGPTSVTTGEPIPPAIVVSKAAGSVREYLNKHGSTRAVMEMKEGEAGKHLPQATVPSYLHLAMSQIAGHPSLPYGGNTAAFVRDAVYMVIMAYADVLETFDKDDDNSKLAEHIIRREEAFRRDALVETIGLGQMFDLAGLAQLADLAQKAGDKDKIYDIFMLLFHNIDNLPGNTWRQQMMQFIAGTPEFVEALQYLSKSMPYTFDDKVTGWADRIAHVHEAYKDKQA